MRTGPAHTTARLLRLAAIALFACTPLASAFGQAAAAASTGPALSRVDLFGGYGYWHPFSSDIDRIRYENIPAGAVGSVTGYFTKYLGVQAEGQYAPNAQHDNACAYTAQGGPVIRDQKGRFVPFLHLLGGGAVVGGPRGQLCNVWGWGVTGGVGLDIILPVFHDRIAVRPIQADFLYSQIDNGPLAAGGSSGGQGQVYTLRGSAGIVLRLGNLKPAENEQPPFNCSADPGNPYPGDPVTLSASTMNVSPKQNPRYLWTSTGGKVTGDGPVASVDTTGMMPGTYYVVGKLVEGARQRLVAGCTASFTVRAYQPPTVSCSASKAAINSGESVTITATGHSTQGLPLTYSYTASSGLIAGSGNTAQLSTAGAAPGNITVTCTVTDDRGKSASTNAYVVVATPAPPVTAVVPQPRSLCGITFDRDRKRPDRVDNESKACLDDIALTLNRETGDKLLMVGSHGPRETSRDAATRAMNAAQYLTQEKGIDPARLDLRIGPDSSRAVSMMLVPPGATVDAGGATSFDTSSVRRIGQAYGKPRATPDPTTTPHRRRRRRRPATVIPPR